MLYLQRRVLVSALQDSRQQLSQLLALEPSLPLDSGCSSCCKVCSSALSAGVHVEHLPFVSVLEATAVRVQPLGEESSWNVDGELLSDNRLSARVQRGALEVFARGVE